MNAYSNLVLAVYLLAVLANNNEKQLIEKLKKGETDFIKWAIALGLVVSISEKLDKFGDYFIVAVYFAMALTAIRNNANIFDNISKVFKIEV